MHQVYSDELYHYGVKGMKWGVRHDKEYQGKGKRKEKGKEKEKRRRLTAKQKKMLKTGAVIAGSVIALYGGYKLGKIIADNYNAKDAIIDPITGFRKLSQLESTDKALKEINPGRVKYFSNKKNIEVINGSSTNCMLCTTAYELRRRGYDVHAGFETSGQGYLPDVLFPKIYSDYKGTTKTRLNNLLGIEHAITKMSAGEDARGNIMVWWKTGGGHSMIWEKVGGNIVFKDGQTDQVYSMTQFQKLLKQTSSRMPVELLRTDNLTLNTTDIKKFINSDTKTKTYIDHGGEVVVNLLADPSVQGSVVAGLGVSTLVKKYKKGESVKDEKRKSNTYS